MEGSRSCTETNQTEDVEGVVASTSTSPRNLPRSLAWSPRSAQGVKNTNVSCNNEIWWGLVGMLGKLKGTAFVKNKKSDMTP